MHPAILSEWTVGGGRSPSPAGNVEVVLGGGRGCGVVIEPPQCSADNKGPRRRQSFFESCMSNGIVIELNILVLKYLDLRIES